MRIALAGCAHATTWPVAPTAEDPRPWERDDRPLHAALRARGVEVDTPAWDDLDADWARYDVVVPRSTWDYHHRRDTFLAWVDRVDRVTRLVNPAAVLRWNTDKRYLRDLDVPQLPTAWVERGEDLRPILAARGWDRAFLKPSVGASAEGTLRFGVGEVDRAQDHLRTWPGDAPFLLQPYVAEVETLGERSAIAIGGTVTHFVAKVPVAGDYRVQDDYGATDAPHQPSAAERELVEAALAAIGEPLAYARVDWLPTAAGPRLVELELVEPCLFFRHGPAAAERLASQLTAGSGP